MSSANPNATAPPAVVLLSGGLDSTTVLAIARSEGFTPYAMSFSYGQRHTFELDRAREVASAGGAAEHRIVDIDLRAFGGSALTDDQLDVPKHADPSTAEIDETEVPITYVPARNTIFLSFAMAWAEVLGARVVYIGVNALDYSGYPDCRPEYIEAFTRMARLATRAGVEDSRDHVEQPFEVRTPLIDLTKAQIIARGLQLGVDYSQTLSCYDPRALPDGTVASCGACDACVLRLRGFAENGMEDPAPYVQRDVP